MDGFFPLFPWLVRSFALLFRDYLLSAFVVSTLSSIAVVLLLRRLAELDVDRAVARNAVWFVLIFPTSYFLHIGYTGSTFLAFALGSFLAARRGKWWLAGLTGALASLTRLNGLLLVPALACEAFLQYRAGERRRRKEWLWIAFVGVGSTATRSPS
jgi:Gpi18-like mannosyltransferase